MKQYKTILLLLVLVLLSGCVKAHNTMTINKDKSMVLESEFLISDKLKEYSSEMMNTEELKDKNVETISKDGYSGYKYSQKFKNIDDYSKNHGEEVIINDVYEKDLNNNLFSVKKGFFKNTYTAKFKYNKTEYSDLENEEVDIEEETSEYDSVDSETEETTEDNTSDEMDMSALNELANLATEMEVSFKVNLPYGSISDNATSKSNGNKTLVWNLSASDKEEINFTFAIFNIMNMALVFGGIILLIIILIVIIIVLKKKKKSEPTLIYKEYDPSIEDKLYDGKNVIIDRSKPENSLEFTLPQERAKDQIEIKEKDPRFYDSTKFVDEELTFDNKKREKLDVPEIENINNKPQ